MQSDVLPLLPLMFLTSPVAEVVVMMARDGMMPERLPLASHVCTDEPDEALSKFWCHSRTCRHSNPRLSAYAAGVARHVILCGCGRHCYIGRRIAGEVTTCMAPVPHCDA